VLRVLDSRPPPARQGEQQGAGAVPQLLRLRLEAGGLQLGEQQRPPLRALLPCLGRLHSLGLAPGSAQLAEGLQLLAGLQELQLEEAGEGLAPLLAPLLRLSSLAFRHVGAKSSQGRVLEAVSGLGQLRRLQARPPLAPWRSKPLRALRAALPRCELLLEPERALREIGGGAGGWAPAE
jgi:hypothetical protein